MSYTYNTERADLEALRHQQQLAAVELAKAERDLAAIRDIETDLARLKRRREKVAQELTEARMRTTAARRSLDLPTPVYGGKVGLLAAAEESRRHTRQKGGK
jgi:hypothetical protein